MKLIYIASPYRIGDMTMNVRVQMEAAHRILNLGQCPIVPLLSHFLHLHQPRPPMDWLAMDLAIVERCDCVLRLPGESKGADGEVDLARHLHIPVVYDFDQLVQWIRINL